MKVDDAKNKTKHIWIDWDPELGDKYGDHFGILLYSWLKNNRKDLLKFRCSGDKYQRVNGWVSDWQKKFPKNIPDPEQ